MAQIEDNSGDREKSVELNLVPFIDLMSVCIIFLLVTAVWTQVSMIQIGSSIYSKRTETGEVEPPPRSEIAFRLDVTEKGYIIRLGKQNSFIGKVNGDFNDEALTKELMGIKQKYPDKKDAIISVMESLTYDNLIRGMDILLNTGFEEISVATQGV